MERFMDKDFLLNTDTARTLYHGYAEKMPIFDYHNHLSPKDICEHRKFRNLTQLWLEGDHYKWRALRANGVDERLITGDAEDKEKFDAFAAVMPKLIGSPIYHWVHLELQRYFDICEPLNPVTADAIWDKTCELLKKDEYDTVHLLEKMKVKVLCTTDDPIDTLEWHKKIKEDETIPFMVCPSFRPDKYLGGNPEAEKALCEKYETSSVTEALEKALDYFKENGCLVSDHGFSDFTYGKDPVMTERLNFLGKAYAKRSIVMQLHMGAIRNTSAKLYAAIGPDAGADSVGLTTDPFSLAAFLQDLEKEDALPKTILYNLNPTDNMLLSTMAGNFAPKVQYGAAWWFNDHIRGMNAQLDELMETYSLSSSVGMLTDSRSFTSFTRHEYFRRILCRKLGQLVEQGEYPDDEKTLGEIVENVCYNNAERFFLG